MNLSLLKEPFKASEIEWRLAQAGKKGNGQIWAKCLAYVQARAIMNRLDEVCGPENWKVCYETVGGLNGISPGVICHLSIRIGDEWVTKSDGAEQTEIEPFKGGISGAIKRAAVAWGIGRYLYELEEGFAKIVDQSSDAYFGRLKKEDGGTSFYWVPPNLPAWALPKGHEVKPNGIHPPQPAHNDGDGDFGDGVYRVPFGQWKSRTLSDVAKNFGPEKIASYVEFLENSAAKKNQPLGQMQVEFITHAEKFLGDLENGKIQIT